ncbi:adenylyltransferase [Nadsonia fulvescens var. elongata DSM 6958]|uniref:Needs CLA4 to survive protein 3 n=1 Tax=Nadsonia fulvescens var. elongata DSM 6958 TaxID=857566 RepID=A0A1E3PPZ9_9ASCO|nr:adenylyltransferase [Nadsonia fulvescens var. elongata DSM 6958]
MSNTDLLERIRQLEDETASLKQKVAAMDVEANSIASDSSVNPPKILKESNDFPLSLEEYQRYGRQLLVPQVGMKGQLKLNNAKVLVVGAGGLGCPSLAYLAGAGVGTIGIVDHDTVDISNVHRQFLHSSVRVGMYKVDSAIEYLKELNSNVTYIPYRFGINNENAFKIFSQYDLVLDCTDLPKTRYLISDVSSLLGMPLVSASALKTDGQLAIYNYLEGPCYRCLFPVPPPANSVLSCGDGGIIGPVVGVMGVMQAIEAIKVITGAYEDGSVEGGFIFGLTLLGAYCSPQWKFIRMRGKKNNCKICGEAPVIKRDMIESGQMDYSEFCGSAGPVKTLSQSERVTVSEYNRVRSESKDHILLDVRDKNQFDIASLPNSQHISLAELRAKKKTISENDLKKPIYVICRLGNDSQNAVKWIKDNHNVDQIWDVIGGLESWSKNVDNMFPRY